MEINTLFQGDCLKGFSLVDTGGVDLVFADPPFNIGYDYDVYDDRKNAGDYLSWCRRWGQEIFRVLKTKGTFWLAIGDEFAAELKLAYQAIGFKCRSWVIWYYTFGVNCKKKFSRSHTHLFQFIKDPRDFIFNGAVIRVPSARQLVYADSRADSAGKLPDDTWILRPQDLQHGLTADQDTWYFPRVCGTFKERAGWHGCQMPEQLLGRIIKVSSNPGDLVLDPFSGSGTTLVVAKKLNRTWIGFELSKNYADQIRSRLGKVQIGQDLEGAEEPKVSAPGTAQGKKLGPIHGSNLTRSSPVKLDQGILEAFIITRDGFSADRVIADRELNQEFTSMCVRLGVPGTPQEWNTRLLNLRKASRLTGLPPSKRTMVAEEGIDLCEFACEIAVQDFHVRGCSLDMLLCDPEKAAELDRLVRAMTPITIPSLLIRWTALKIRKRAHAMRRQRQLLESFIKPPVKKDYASNLDLEKVPCSPGLYWLQSADTGAKLYVGKTHNLRQRLQNQITNSTFDFWGTARQSLEIRYREMTRTENILRGNQSYWIGKWKPQGNYCKLGGL